MIHFNFSYYNILKDVINKFWIVHPQNHVGSFNGSMFFLTNSATDWMGFGDVDLPVLSLVASICSLIFIFFFR